MVLLTNIWHLPMVMWFIIPLAAVLLLDIVLLVEGRVPDRYNKRKLQKHHGKDMHHT